MTATAIDQRGGGLLDARACKGGSQPADDVGHDLRALRFVQWFMAKLRIEAAFYAGQIGQRCRDRRRYYIVRAPMDDQRWNR